MPTLSARAVDGDGFKFVRGIPGQDFTLALACPVYPLTATASGVRSALLKGVFKCAVAELTVGSPLDDELLITRLNGVGAPLNRFSILGH